MRALISRFKKKKDYAVTIGSFDGIHLGHQHLISVLSQEAEKLNLPSLLITFWPHPESVLKPKKFKGCITPLPEKEHLLRTAELDYFLVLHAVKSLLNLSGEDFIRKLLRRINIKLVVVGDDFRFGYRAENTVEDLKNMSSVYGFKVKVVKKIISGGNIVSSSLIRQNISAGKVEDVSCFLGRNFSLQGRIIKGKGLGRKIGFPTLNIISPGIVLPKKGVYAVKIMLGNRQYLGACNIGRAPTASQAKKVTVEVHVLDFDHKLSYKNVRLEFLKRIRDEKKFSSLVFLQKAIAQDIVLIRKFFPA